MAGRGGEVRGRGYLTFDARSRSDVISKGGGWGVCDPETKVAQNSPASRNPMKPRGGGGPRPRNQKCRKSYETYRSATKTGLRYREVPEKCQKRKIPNLAEMSIDKEPDDPMKTG